MKKKVALFLACAMMMIFAACGAIGVAVSTIPDKNSLYLTLVNKDHELPDDWLDQIELVTDFDPWGDEVQIERETLEHFADFSAFLLAECGIDIRLESVYRSVADQEWLWEEFKNKYGEEYCQQYVAKPGYSEHHTGLAVDICIAKDGEIINDNDEMIAMEDVFSKIHYYMAEYGFILRYPPNKEDITGYAYEPWHLRYVGVLPAAEITIRHITLEEYLAEP